MRKNNSKVKSQKSKIESLDERIFGSIAKDAKKAKDAKERL
jgi:hypothetical protein